MKLRARHSTTGVRFREMDDETLRKVLRRTYRMAADSLDDRHSAKAELQRRKAERNA
jgi:hypothetical protein